MARMITGLTVERVRENVAAVREEIEAACGRAGHDPAAVTLLAAVKYVAIDELWTLAPAGLEVAGENRAQELLPKAERAPELRWHFIGHLQSRKVKQIVPHVELIHSVASESVVAQLGKHAAPGTPVLIEVNVAEEQGKSGVAPGELPAFLEHCRAVGGVDVRGLMTMPPLAEDPQDSRRWFAALADLARAHDLPELSMGTTQDFAVAVEEGATIVRLGTRLYS